MENTAFSPLFNEPIVQCYSLSNKEPFYRKITCSGTLDPIGTEVGGRFNDINFIKSLPSLLSISEKISLKTVLKISTIKITYP